MADALAFLRLWPEVKTYQVTVTAKGEKPLFHEAHMGADTLSSKVARLLQLAEERNAHFFVRPENPGAILVDLDCYEDAHLSAIKDLCPRCIVRTSSDKRHAWFWTPRLNDAQSAVLRAEFAGALLGDPRSTGARQCGRMPGSRNPKNGCGVQLVYASAGAESSWALLQAPRPKLTRSAFPDNYQREAKPQEAGGRGAEPGEKVRGGGVTDRSCRDWAHVMTHLEKNWPDMPKKEKQEQQELT